MATYMFPGQGSEALGMGGELFSEFPELVEKADQLLGYSIQTLCFENPNGRLETGEYNQPAIFVVNALSYLKKQKEINRQPDYLLGHSLGEYNALLAAGVFDFETGLKLILKRNELMHQVTGGGMAVLLGLRSAEVEALLKQHNLNKTIIANYNAHTHLVIAGPKDEIEAARPIFIKAKALLFKALDVSVASHTIYMNAVQQEFADFINQFTFHPPLIPVIANVNAKPYPSQAHEVQANLVAQIAQPVLWRQSIEYLLEISELDFQEIGAGSILTNLMRHIINKQKHS